MWQNIPDKAYDQSENLEYNAFAYDDFADVQGSREITRLWVPLDRDWTSFKRRCKYVVQFMNIFNSNLGQLLMTKSKEENKN